MSGVYQPSRLRRMQISRNNRVLRRASCLVVLLCAAAGGCSAPLHTATSFSTDRLKDLAIQHQQAADGTLVFLRDRQKINSLIARSQEQYRNGDLTGARKSLRLIRDLEPYCPSVFELEAQIALDLGEADAYQALLLETLAANPQSARIQNRVGQCLVEAGGVSRGIQALERATELDPRNARYARDLAASLYRQGELSAARQVLARAIAENPGESSLHLALARLLEDCAEWTAAARCYEALLAIHPNQRHLQQQHARCLTKIVEYPQVAEVVGDRTEVSHGDAALQEHIDQGNRYLQLNDYHQAQQVFDSISVQVPRTFAEVEALRGICALNRGAPDMAMSILVAAITEWPEDAQLQELVDLSKTRRIPNGTLVSANLP